MPSPRTPAHLRLRVGKAFGLRVRLLRKAAGYSQEELGQRSAMHRTYVGDLEKGEIVPGLLVIISLAGALDISPCELVNGLARWVPPEEVPGRWIPEQRSGTAE